MLILTPIDQSLAARLLGCEVKELGSGTGCFMDTDGVVWWDDAHDDHGWNLITDDGRRMRKSDAVIKTR